MEEEIAERKEELPVIVLEVRRGGAPSQRRLTEEKRGKRTEIKEDRQTDRHTDDVTTSQITHVTPSVKGLVMIRLQQRLIKCPTDFNKG